MAVEVVAEVRDAAAAGRPVVIDARVKSILDVQAVRERFSSGLRTPALPRLPCARFRVGTPHPRGRPRDVARRTCSVRDRGREPDPGRQAARSRGAPTGSGRRAAGRQRSRQHADHIRRATDGRSPEANIEVYRNNIVVGAEIARVLEEGR